MSILDDFLPWLSDNDPVTMPFYPGARQTGRVGMRDDIAILDAGASPFHLGCDRSGGEHLVMPFDGSLSWWRVGGVAGSVLSLTPRGLPFMQIQVMHTESDDKHMMEIGDTLNRGDLLPVHAGDTGLSSGVHTHTEVLFQFDKKLLDWVVSGVSPIVEDGKVHQPTVKAHCDEWGLHYERFYGDARAQVETWGIRDFWPRAAVRGKLPYYREPPWVTETIHVDSLWLLQI